jgi:anti-sigma regulatory factor (Ser/Thr protein kinase)
VSDVVTLQLPRQSEFLGVAHLVLGGLAARLDLTYDVLDDITTAIDELLQRREVEGEVIVTVSVDGETLSTSVGPFGERVAGELHEPGQGFGLRRVLETVVDRVTVSERDGAQWVELEKALGGGRAVVG